MPTSEPLVERMRGFGTTVFAEMSLLAARTGALNLGQGFPDTDGPPEVLEEAQRAIRDGVNQYPPGTGHVVLREAVARHQQEWYGLTYDPATEVLITTGATEGVSAALLALCETGDEVVALDPTYDSYAAAATMARAVLRPVTLRPPDFALDLDALRAAITPRTRVLLVNSPHNPTGRVLTEAELAGIAALAVEHDLWVVCDEVYEHLTFDGHVHRPLAGFPGMRERTVLVSSAGKTFNVTGWKIGWVCAPPALVTAVNATKQFLTFSGGAPFQPAVALGLGLPRERFAEIRDRLQAGRDLLTEGLRRAGLEVFGAQGTYFVNVDIASIGETDGIAFCRGLPDRVGVVAVPTQVFHADPASAATLVRFAFCKRPEVLAEAAERLARL
ncbi:pyridoxal phosphate-dependent aminotransferase [Auraticoccus monumenti]|uniref:N-succinyldiaminopimelate aminotransferase n=1 Tax=Auraticoccus monumenti TaxID=675864 RepID=A0A1G6ZKB9_9ACTN|nr:pyridoxal phosphate-dependent aminotransferase [Auraticoccus monumenti]SDE03099.1 N-succinyldiaminopimelate aminotransferase [Auraticoccus monumenti]